MLDTKLTKSIAFHPQTNGQTVVVNIIIVHVLLCTIQSIHANGTRASPMYKIDIPYLSRVKLVIAPFRWVWDSNHYVPLT